MIINSEGGRIGPFWWFNSNPIPSKKMIPLVIGSLDTGIVQQMRVIQWGTCGLGRNVRIDWEPIDG